MNWTQEQAIAACIKIEGYAPLFGCHVALTGGLLYRTGVRKDCDIILYRIRQVGEIQFDALFAELELKLGIVKKSGFGFCIKAEYEGKRIDFLCPEEEGNYEPDVLDDLLKPIDPLEEPLTGSL